MNTRVIACILLVGCTDHTPAPPAPDTTPPAAPAKQVPVSQPSVAEEAMAALDDAIRRVSVVTLDGIEYLPHRRVEGRTDDLLVLTGRVENRTDQPIHAAKYELHFKNSFDEQVASVTVDVDDEDIPPRSSHAVTWGIYYNDFVPAHQAIRRFDLRRGHVEVEARIIVFADGKRLTSSAEVVLR